MVHVFLVFILGFWISCSESIKDQLNRAASQVRASNSSDRFEELSSRDEGCDFDCEKSCRRIFIKDENYRRCLDLPQSSLSMIEKVEDKMREGRWSSINARDLEELVSISHDVWERWAGQSSPGARNMLLWIVDEEGVSDHLNKAVLKEALSTLSYRNNNRGVIEGLTTVIREGKTFLEWAAWMKDDRAFLKTHEVILEVCLQRQICIERIYCMQASGIVVDMAVRLGLSKQIIKGSDGPFDRGFCS